MDELQKFALAEVEGREIIKFSLPEMEQLTYMMNTQINHHFGFDKQVAANVIKNIVTYLAESLEDPLNKMSAKDFADLLTKILALCTTYFYMGTMLHRIKQ